MTGLGKALAGAAHGIGALAIATNVCACVVLWKAPGPSVR